MPEPTLLAALDEGVLTLTLNRPAKLNAIDHTLAAALLDALQAAADDPQVRVMLAAVHGWTVGAGFEWAMDADVVVAADDARFKLPEASLGVFVTGGLVATLPAAAGLPRAKALMLLGEAFDAAQAVDWGLVHRAVPRAQLDEVSMATCRQLAALEPAVVAHYKRVLNAVGLERFGRAIEEESHATRALTQADPPRA